MIEVRPPIQPPKERVSYDTATQRLVPTVAASLKTALKNIKKPEENGDTADIKEGDCCKNNGCKQTYPPTSDECKYHPGYPVFHEVLLSAFTVAVIQNLMFPGYEVLVLLSEENVRVSTFS